MGHQDRQQVPAHVRLHVLAQRAIARLGRRVDQSHCDPDLRGRQRLIEEALDLAMLLREQAATQILRATRPHDD